MSTTPNWHRMDLIWDGYNRILYVDDIQVARNTKVSPEGSNNCLYVGTDKAMEAGTYWSGLIDDVRIYNSTIVPWQIETLAQ